MRTFLLVTVFLGHTLAVGAELRLSAEPCSNFVKSASVVANENNVLAENVFGLTSNGTLLQRQRINYGPWKCYQLGPNLNGGTYTGIVAENPPVNGVVNVYVVSAQGALEQFQWVFSQGWGHHFISQNLNGPRLSSLDRVVTSGGGVYIYGRAKGSNRPLEYSWVYPQGWSYRFL